MIALPKEVILEEGGPAKGMFVITRGRCEVIVKVNEQPTKDSTPEYTQGSPDSKDKKRGSSARSRRSSILHKRHTTRSSGAAVGHSSSPPQPRKPKIGRAWAVCGMCLGMPLGTAQANARKLPKMRSTC